MMSDGDRSDDESGAGNRELLERKVARSRWIMLLEAAWPRLWLPISVAALFVLLSMAGLWPLLPGVLHVLLLVLFLAAFLASFVPLYLLALPERATALRWLERRSGLPHRPASTLDDRLAAGDDASRALWQAHLQRMRRHVEAMQTGLPRPDTARLDPYALRVPLLLALFVAFGLSPQRFGAGLGEAFAFGAARDTAGLRLDAWITPPSYTRAPAQVLADGGIAGAKPGKPVSVPQNSELAVRVWGVGAGEARLALLPRSSDATQPQNGAGKPEIVSSNDGKVEDMRAKLSASTLAELTLDGKRVASFDIAVTPDLAPSIELTEPPAPTARNTLRLAYRVTDDYGVAEAHARFRRVVTRPDGTPEPETAYPSSPAPDDLTTPLGEPPDVALSLPKAGSKQGNARTYTDLTAHLWAGLPVEMWLTARDDASNTGRSTPRSFVLPARDFRKPLAQAIVRLRRDLADRPSERQAVAAALDTLTDAEATPVEQAGVYLGLRSAYWRLQDAADRDALRSVVDQLWTIALTIEDGNISQAERDLRAAQDKLMDALADNASPEELEKLMKELRQALSQFLNAMAQKQQQQPGEQPQGGEQQTITARQLDEMLRNIENLAKTGARDAAQQMLSQLRDMLENLDRGGQGQQSAGDQQMRRSLDDLGRMIMNQRKLLDDTHRNGQRQPGEGMPQDGQGESGDPQQGEGMQGGREAGGQPGRGQGRQPGEGRGEGRRAGQQQQGSGGQGGDLQQRQGQLLDELNGLLDKLSGMGAKIPEDLMRAGGNMGRAERELGEDRLGSAQNEQGRALDNLRKGAQSLAEQMMQNRRGRNGQAGRDNRDPLGRPQRTNGPEFGDDVEVPDEIDTQRARNILEELRRRASEANRPADELDYLERLIEQF